MYKIYWDYLEKILGKDTLIGQQSKNINKININYSRYYHTKRVFNYLNNIIENENKIININALKIACILHDIGYNKSPNNHAIESARMAEAFLDSINYNKDDKQLIIYLIENHSKKNLLDDTNTPLELIYLLEADLLDDTGALGLILDMWIEIKNNENPSFESIYKGLNDYSLDVINKNPMRSEYSKKIWNKKKKLVIDFMNQLKFDLGDKDE